MKLLITTAALALCLGVPTYALQSQDKEKDKPAPQDEPRKDPRQQQSDKDRGKQDRDRTQQQDRDIRDRERTRPDRDRQDRDRAQGQGREQRAPEPPRDNRNRVQSQSSDRHSTRASGTRGRRIPDDRYRASFGREHSFHLERSGSRGGGRVQGAEGQRFHYAGYWFEYTEGWPSEWSYDDDFYIDYIDDDYYLYDVRYPSVRVLVIVAE